MRRPLLLVATMAAIGVPAAPAWSQGAPPAGMTLDGCQGQLDSVYAEGSQTHSVTVPGAPGSSSSAPLLVAHDGAVAYGGSTTAVITDATWGVSVYGVPVQSGTAANAGGETSRSDAVAVSDYLPLKVAGLFYVSGHFSGTGGACTGDVWVKLVGSPVGTIPWDVGVGLAALGLVGLFFSLPQKLAVKAVWHGPGPADGAPVAAEAPVDGVKKRRWHPVLGGFSGLGLGLGLALLAITHAIVPFGSLTPIIVLVGGLLLGIGLGIFGPALRRSDES